MTPARSAGVLAAGTIQKPPTNGAAGRTRPTGQPVLIRSSNSYPLTGTATLRYDFQSRRQNAKSRHRVTIQSKRERDLRNHPKESPVMTTLESPTIYVLEGLIRCRKCDAELRVRPLGDAGIFAYRCPVCTETTPSRSMPADELERWLLRQVTNTVMTESNTRMLT